MRKLLWKVCGMRDESNILEVLKLEPDFMGFIFFDKSPRNISPNKELPLLESFPSTTKKIGVFVNESEEVILNKAKSYYLDGVQLHGNESPILCKSLKAQNLFVIKAFSVGVKFDFDLLLPYMEVVDLFLFDTKAKGGYGGHGVTFDWELLKSYPYEKPYLLAGGVSLENLDKLKLLSATPIHGIDVNSKFETEPGLKNVVMLKSLVENLN